MTFMIVDDSRLSRRKLTDFVQRLGYDVVCDAVDGVDALEKFELYKPDYVLTDLEMPNMKGDELSKRILEIDSSIVVILITSIADKKELLNAIRLGVRKVIKKPVDFEVLNLALKELMEK